MLGSTVFSFAYPPPARGQDLFAGSNWGGQKVLWIATPRYRGPVLLRGHQLDGPAGVRFERGRIPASAIELNAAGAYSAGEPNGWREWPSCTRLQASGCYAYQVDGTNFTTVIVFRALATATHARLVKPGGTVVGSGTGAGRAVYRW